MLQQSMMYFWFVFWVFGRRRTSLLVLELKSFGILWSRLFWFGLQSFREISYRDVCLLTIIPEQVLALSMWCSKRLKYIWKTQQWGCTSVRISIHIYRGLEHQSNRSRTLLIVSLVSFSRHELHSKCKWKESVTITVQKCEKRTA